jgi:hypothetical protein
MMELSYQLEKVSSNSRSWRLIGCQMVLLQLSCECCTLLTDYTNIRLENELKDIMVSEIVK